MKDVTLTNLGDHIVVKADKYHMSVIERLIMDSLEVYGYTVKLKNQFPDIPNLPNELKPENYGYGLNRPES